MSAFDYERQEWVEGQRAISLRQQQLRKELEVLKSDRGDEYCRMIGIPVRTERIELIERELAQVEGKEVAPA